MTPSPEAPAPGTEQKNQKDIATCARCKASFEMTYENYTAHFDKYCLVFNPQP